MNQQSPKTLSPNDLYGWLSNASGKPVLVDVREDQELAIAPFPFPVLHLPLTKSDLWIKNLAQELPKSQSLVVICHSGIRSWNFATWLIEQGWNGEVWNLEGGIDAWSVNVDSSVPRY